MNVPYLKYVLILSTKILDLAAYGSFVTTDAE